LGRKIKAQKIIFNVDKPESFLELVSQKLKKTVRELKSKEQALISTSLPLASNIQRTNKAGQCAIKVTDLTKKYDDFVAVKKLNIEVNYGEIFGFLGPNGAGKTTTINTIVGLLKPDAGSIKIGNFDLKSETLEAKAMFGYVAETPIVYENLTGAEFLQFVAKLYPVNKPDTTGRIERFLDLFNLNEWKDKPIKVYSQGMRRKIAIAAALVHNPRILILDEPTNGLDPAGIHKVKEVLFELRSKKVAILMSTHILEIAERMCDRVGIINRGRIVAQGQLSELLKSTKDKKSSLEEIFLNLTK
jgi:ABC-2 type transport system ATP-binding protein